MADPTRDPLLVRHEYYAKKIVKGLGVKIDHIGSAKFALDYVKRLMSADCWTVWLRDKGIHTIKRILFDMTNVDMHDDKHPLNIRRLKEIERLSVTSDEWLTCDLVLSFGNPPFRNVIIQRIDEDSFIEVALDV